WRPVPFAAQPGGGGPRPRRGGTGQADQGGPPGRPAEDPPRVGRGAAARPDDLGRAGTGRPGGQRHRAGGRRRQRGAHVAGRRRGRGRRAHATGLRGGPGLDHRYGRGRVEALNAEPSAVNWRTLMTAVTDKAAEVPLGAWQLPGELVALGDTVRRFMRNEVAPIEEE